MPQYTLKSVTDPSLELFAGTYTSLSAAVEAAIRDDVALDGVDLSNAVLTGANLSDGQFNGASFRKTNFSGSRLDRANCTGADFSGAFLSWSSARSLKAEGACFFGAEINSSHYVSCDFTTADLRVQKAKDSVFWDGQMAEARFSPALLESDLSCTRLVGSVLIEAQSEAEYRITKPHSYLRVSGGKRPPISLLVTQQEVFIALSNISDTLPPAAKILKNNPLGPFTPNPQRFLVIALDDVLRFANTLKMLAFSSDEADALAAIFRVYAASGLIGSRERTVK